MTASNTKPDSQMQLALSRDSVVASKSTAASAAFGVLLLVIIEEISVDFIDWVCEYPFYTHFMLHQIIAK